MGVRPDLPNGAPPDDPATPVPGHAERLAAESGWYEGDPEGLLGQLDGSLFRARRLVVDTGLHAKRWTREQAIAYGIEPSEIERYVVLPGQACAYMLGQLAMIDLRERARTALGPQVSIREFHKVVLGTERRRAPCSSGRSTNTSRPHASSGREACSQTLRC